MCCNSVSGSYMCCKVVQVTYMCCKAVLRSYTGHLSDQTVTSSWYDILLCSETLVLDMRHVSELLVPGILHPVLLCRGRMPRARGIVAHVLDRYGAFHHPKSESGCCEMLFLWFVV